MQRLEARLTVCEIIPAEQWASFTDWLEAAEEPCEHDASSYEPWLAAHDVDVAQASKLYEAMRELAPGPCRCAAAAEIWPATPLHQTIRGPVVWCRPEALPPALTGQPAAGREVQLTWFFAAHRGDLGEFWDAVEEPEAHADWDDALDLLGLLCELVASDRELAWAAVDVNQRVESFYHGGDADEVERWLRERGHSLHPLEAALDRLAVFVLTSASGPVSEVHLGVDGSPALFYAARPEIVVVRASERTIWAEGWKPLPAGPTRIETSAGPIDLPETIVAGVHELSVPAA
ncbi:hypothetical protein DB30_05684 [Enhygromyxa salina]|uniref:Uncharacterized protein n=1 Tax=Enhygromyxa salina TaxID=215803 RepID=A0A0C2D5M4_9BACT|nr:hypothetical protein [Enhygromyxa salina]KIG15352.1 hypothetical protein DB30_05684 [Enhygromyxa salina]